MPRDAQGRPTRTEINRPELVRQSKSAVRKAMGWPKPKRCKGCHKMTRQATGRVSLPSLAGLKRTMGLP